VAGSKLEQPVPILDRVHAGCGALGVKVTRFVEDFLGARLPNPDEERILQLPSGLPMIRNVRTAYAGDQPVAGLDRCRRLALDLITTGLDGGRRVSLVRRTTVPRPTNDTRVGQVVEDH